MEKLMSQRIQILKEKMLSSPRYASIEQARIITRVYQENESLSVPKKRALSLKTAMEELEIGFEKEELIVGNRTKGVRYGVVFPESGCSWICLLYTSTIAQASRISGINPADISVLLIYLKQHY